MRLRRSDIRVWDHGKATAWQRVKRASDQRFRLADEDDGGETLAWAMKRANARGTYALIERASTIGLLVAIGTLRIEADRPMGHAARAALGRTMAVMPSEQRGWLQLVQ